MSSETTLKSTNPVRCTLPSCPACRESYKFEPLKREPGIWRFRCVRCGAGVELLDYNYADRRRIVSEPGVDRRRRMTDLRVAAPCEHCGRYEVRGWLLTEHAVWVRCDCCLRVKQLERAPDAIRRSELLYDEVACQI
jgi:hypothetical protein